MMRRPNSLLHMRLIRGTMIAVGVGVPGYKARPGTVLPVILTREQLVNLHT